MPKFKMRAKPSKPVRKSVNVYRHIWSDSTGTDILKIIDEAREFGVPPEKIVFCVGYGDYDESYDLRYARPETDAEFQVRLDKYEKDLAKWKAWELKNRDKIKAYEQEEQERREKEREHFRRVEEKEKRARLKKLEKELAALKKEVGD